MSEAIFFSLIVMAKLQDKETEIESYEDANRNTSQGQKHQASE